MASCTVHDPDAAVLLIGSHLPGYGAVRKDRENNGRNGGGVRIYVRININFQIRVDFSPSNIKHLKPGFH